MNDRTRSFIYHLLPQSVSYFNERSDPTISHTTATTPLPCAVPTSITVLSVSLGLIFVPVNFAALLSDMSLWGTVPLGLRVFRLRQSQAWSNGRAKSSCTVRFMVRPHPMRCIFHILSPLRCLLFFGIGLLSVHQLLCWDRHPSSMSIRVRVAVCWSMMHVTPTILPPAPP